MDELEEVVCPYSSEFCPEERCVHASGHWHSYPNPKIEEDFECICVCNCDAEGQQSCALGI